MLLAINEMMIYFIGRPMETGFKFFVMVTIRVFIVNFSLMVEQQDLSIKRQNIEGRRENRGNVDVFCKSYF